MKLDFQAERILAIVAHPDDAELCCAGTLARAKSEGAMVGICVLCRGDKGQPSKAVVTLAANRRKEMSASARLLGAQLFFGGVPDGQLVESVSTRLKLIEILRRFEPTLVLAHAPEDYHPDHRSASALAEAATWLSASRGHKTRSTALPRAPALWWMDTIGMHAFVPGFYVDISRTLALKHKMLACHQTQLQRGADDDFSSLPELMRLQSSARGMQASVQAAEAFRQHFVFKRVRAW
jgi:LmbE family N-acetylglucosaminyl deacetylase